MISDLAFLYSTFIALLAIYELWVTKGRSIKFSLLFTTVKIPIFFSYGEFELDVFGRLDFLLAYLYLILNIKRVKILFSHKITLLPVLFLIIIFLHGFLNSSIEFSFFYYSLSLNVIGLSIYLSLKEVNSSLFNVLLLWILSLFVLIGVLDHLLQINEHTKSVFFTFYDNVIYRGSGLSKTPYSYSSTFALLALIYIISSINKRRKNSILYFGLLSTAPASKAFFFGAFLGALGYKFRKLPLSALVVLLSVIVLTVSIYDFSDVQQSLSKSTLLKLSLWKEAILESPYSFFGNGPGSSDLVIGKIPYEELVVFGVDPVIANLESFPIHNIFIKLLYEYGFFSFLLHFLQYAVISLFFIKRDAVVSIIIAALFFDTMFHNVFNYTHLVLIIFLMRDYIKNERRSYQN